MKTASTEQHRVSTPHGDLFAQCWIPTEQLGPPIILLHDSLGCVSLWQSFPEALALECSRKVIAYDRLGFGRSAVHPGTLPASFVQDEASGAFAAVCRHFGVSRFLVMGHSVGAGMAICCAATYPQDCEGVISISAQAFVDDRIRAGIRAADIQFAEPAKFQKLEKYHADKARWVLRAFVDTWLSEAFRDWSLDQQLLTIRCPLLCLHGDRDEYGSRQHPEHMVALVGERATLHMLQDCGHAPHRECLTELLDHICTFLEGHSQVS